MTTKLPKETANAALRCNLTMLFNEVAFSRPFERAQGRPSKPLSSCSPYSHARKKSSSGSTQPAKLVLQQTCRRANWDGGSAVLLVIQIGWMNSACVPGDQLRNPCSAPD